jgi:hypothetical protein
MKRINHERGWSSDRTGSRSGDAALCAVFGANSAYESKYCMTWETYAYDEVIFWEHSIIAVCPIRAPVEAQP